MEGKELKYMNIVMRCYEDEVTKPHIDETTFKFRLYDEVDMDTFHDEAEEFVLERFTTWQQLREEANDCGD